ncbi:MAG: hypothetical protein ACFBSD_11270 [Paracoccaceae bacterium]
MPIVSHFVAAQATAAGLALGLALGVGLAVVTHAAIAREGSK